MKTTCVVKFFLRFYELETKVTPGVTLVQNGQKLTTENQNNSSMISIPLVRSVL